MKVKLLETKALDSMLCVIGAQFGGQRSHGTGQSSLGGTADSQSTQLGMHLH